MRMFVLCILLGMLAVNPAARAQDVAVVNAKIWTGNPAQPHAEALLARAGRLIAVGTNEAIRAQLPPDVRLIDAAGRMVTPGFIDAHVHFLVGGFRLASVQLRDARTPQEFIRRIRDFAATVPAGTWILGGDWDHEQWGGELPQRSWIDSVTTQHPVWISRLDGHMALANSLTLQIAGVSAATEEVKGGSIVRDRSGEPTGILKDNAMNLVWPHVPDAPAQIKDRALQAAMHYVAQQGVTTVHSMGTWDDLVVYRRAREQGTLRTRIYAVVPLHSWAKLRDEVARTGRGDAWLRIGGLKGFVDGSLGSHTASFFEPFDDDPDNTGLLLIDEKSLFEQVAGADAAGLQVMVHAIGDQANDMLLTIFERVAARNGARDRRFRIEHAQHLRPQDIPRFAQLGVIASMQPYHAIDDGRWAEKVIGTERSKTTYAFRSLLQQGARLAFGSDWFVAPPTPLEGIYAAVTRRTLDGKNPDGWVPEQKISLEQALRAYTLAGAYASFEENEKGSLAPGKLADFVIIDRDLFSIRPETIREAQVDFTVVGGRVVFERADSNAP